MASGSQALAEKKITMDFTISLRKKKGMQKEEHRDC